MNYEELQQTVLKIYRKQLEHESKYDEQFEKVVDEQTDKIFGKIYKLTKGNAISNVDLYGNKALLLKFSTIFTDAVKDIENANNISGRLYQAMHALNIDLAKATNLEIDNDKETIQKRVNKKNPMDSLTLKQRLSKHRQEYYDKLMQLVVINAAQKKSMSDFADAIEKQVRGMCYAHGRIMTTELNSFLNEALVDIYKQLGIKNVEFSAVEDDRTSWMCHENDGKVFAISDLHTSVNKPPLHPHCRSILLPHE